ncbi:hypothetical protein AB0C93_34795 [Streptomyces sp. NPDC048518]|uniref:hypothetical protein n=1 Tax=Streptomyces sp. NPDC048518 TaxID=3155029 RepID=UPI0034036C6E
MRIRRTTIALAVAAAGLTVPAVASPAGAVGDSCAVPGAAGSFNFSWDGKYRLKGLKLTVKDTAADNHHAAIRLITVRSNNTAKTWSWHHNYKGKNKTQTWPTSANDTAGIKRASIEVGVLEGDNDLHTCGVGSIKNPNW